jgi:hypothetical protein
VNTLTHALIIRSGSYRSAGFICPAYEWTCDCASSRAPIGWKPCGMGDRGPLPRPIGECDPDRRCDRVPIGEDDLELCANGFGERAPDGTNCCGSG